MSSMDNLSFTCTNIVIVRGDSSLLLSLCLNEARESPFLCHLGDPSMPILLIKE